MGKKKDIEIIMQETWTTNGVTDVKAFDGKGKDISKIAPVAKFIKEYEERLNTMMNLYKKMPMVFDPDESPKGE